MALQTDQIVSLYGGAVTVDVTFDDQALYVTSVSWTNTSGLTPSFKVTFGNRSKSGQIPAGSGSLNMPKSWFTYTLAAGDDGVVAPQPNWTLAVT